MMDSKGYVFTLVTTVLLLLAISLSAFYFRVSQPQMQDTITNIQTDELHYFVESIKTDFNRAASITSQRALVYLLDYIMDRDQAGFDQIRYYEMYPCSDIVYKPNGSQAALAELILCNTLNGVSTGVAEYMENNTLYNWTLNVTKFANESGYVAQIKLLNATIRPFGAYNMVVIAEMQVYIRDKSNLSFYVGNFTAFSPVPLSFLPDPLYDVLGGNPELTLNRSFIPCNENGIINAPRIDEWINTSCYLNTSTLFRAPTIFDRLEGNYTVSDLKYYTQAAWIAGLSGIEYAGDAGLESFVDLDKFSDTYGIAVNMDYTWVDYLYWQNITGQCWVEDMVYHPDFKVGWNHTVEYQMQGINCGGVRVCNALYMCGVVDGVCPESFGATCGNYSGIYNDPDCATLADFTVCNGKYPVGTCEECLEISGKTECCVNPLWESDELIVLDTPGSCNEMCFDNPSPSYSVGVCRVGGCVGGEEALAGNPGCDTVFPTCCCTPTP